MARIRAPPDMAGPALRASGCCTPRQVQLYPRGKTEWRTSVARLLAVHRR